MAKHLRLFDPAAVPDSDPELARKFIRCLMWQGKKATAQRIFDAALKQVRKRLPGVDPLDVFTQAVERVKPTVEVRSKRVGGATYRVPMQVGKGRQQSLAIRWIITAVRGKAGRPMYLRLAEEILAASGRCPPTGPSGACPMAAYAVLLSPRDACPTR
jgi:small subunit ribosomal protein S7